MEAKTSSEPTELIRPNEESQFIEKVKKVVADNQLDLSSDEDLSIGIMNLISIEEHLFFTASKTKNDKYYHLLKEIREMRKELLKEIIITYEGEVWCTSKHLLSSSMRLMEVGTKSLGKGDIDKAKTFFEKSYRLYKMFWEINLKLTNEIGRESREKYAPDEILLFYDIDCPHCKNVASFLAKNNIDAAFKITKKDVSQNVNNLEEMKNIYKNCNINKKLEVPLVSYDEKCFMGEDEVIKLFKKLMWDNVIEKKEVMNKLVKENGNRENIQNHEEEFSKALEASLDCCKE